MSETIIRDGSEWPVRPALEYLERRYNIPAAHIRSVTITGTAGEPATITVTLTVETEPTADHDIPPGVVPHPFLPDPADRTLCCALVDYWIEPGARSDSPRAGVRRVPCGGVRPQQHKHMFVADEHHPLYARCEAPADPPCTAYLRHDYSQRGDQS